MSWLHEVRIKDICDLITIKTNIKNASIENYISTENMLPNFGGVEYAEKIPASNTVNTFIPQDVLFSNIRTYFKKVWFSRFNGTASADVLVFRAKDNCDSKFLYYLMCDPSFIEYTVLTSKGAKMPRGDKDAIFSYPVLLPSLKEQKAIASVLSSLDDKIDLLHRQNKTLESMAETLFRQWFIEEEKEGWAELPLKDLVYIIDNRGKTPPYLSVKTPYPIIEVNALTKFGRNVDYSVIRKYVDSYTFNTWFRKHLEPSDILVSTVGSIGTFSMFSSGSGCIAQNVIGLRSKNEKHNNFIYQWLLENTPAIKELDIGSVQPSIKVPHLLSLTVKTPDIGKLEEFNSHIKTMVNKIFFNSDKIKQLEQIRDTLLPKLISGEVRVEYAEEAIASVA